MTAFLLPIIYLAFISLGLPDSLLGSAWPVMYKELGVGISSSGIIFMIISLGTVLSSLNSDRLTRLLGAGKVTALSVVTTAVALFGFSISHSFPVLCLWAIPYGLGAGSVDAALNNYVALHYESRHMSWLHCMWGVGAALGPVIMRRVLFGGGSWNQGYRTISMMQVVLSAVLFGTLSFWHKPSQTGKPDSSGNSKPLSLRQVVAVPGAKAIMGCFFCYCALEQTVGLWASSYLVLARGIDTVAAAGYASLFFLGITAGRALSGFATFKLNDAQMVRVGIGLILAGILLIVLPFGNWSALSGLILIGLGCAPVYPSLIHATPLYFGAERSQSMIGVQMASAYIGTSLMPPLFGQLVKLAPIGILPFYLLVLCLLIAVLHENLVDRRVRVQDGGCCCP